MVLMRELRVGKSIETQGKPLLEETHSVMGDGAIQLPCHLDTVLAGRNYFFLNGAQYRFFFCWLFV